MNIQIKSLHCFVTLLEVGNYTRAAERLHLTQPTLTKMIQRLEEHLEQPLLIRNNQKVIATEAGRLLQNSAKQIVGQWHRLQEEMNSLNGLQTGQLRLGVCPMMGEMVIDLLSQYRQRFPRIDVSIVELGGFAAEQALLNDTLDLTFTALPTTHTQDFCSHNLGGYPLFACLPKAHLLTKKASISWSDLADSPFILYNDDFSLAKLIRRLTHKANIELNIAAQSGQWDFIAAMVESKMGLAILPEPICQKVNSAQLEYRPLSPDLTWDLALIWRKNLPLTPAAESFIRLSQELSPEN
ncbi:MULTISPECIES: LysR family transcriptional regulator [unclassified Shewanella]|uniref:LysR family transcriptional regulator n=1 Tax=unclassified Shewanella TaxID=196818 RepID=UPI001BBA9C0B|nr:MULTISPECIES: LysR family transcriptional regulator [unclassified Shewanella]GIU06702.1 LysR family transcriptional regulator [Shewanella sp. MBTL60-112-B1]GIU26477.1 LysR family transcriptional regulator [Shewanella sp. MBTL60-112-B2]